MTLRPHPRQFFHPDIAPNILTSPQKKEILLAEAGVDGAVLMLNEGSVGGSGWTDVSGGALCVSEGGTLCYQRTLALTAGDMFGGTAGQFSRFFFCWAFTILRHFPRRNH